MAIQSNDFQSGSLSGSVDVAGGKIVLELPTKKIPLEGDKSFVVKVRTGSTSGPVVATSPSLTLKDYSQIVSVTPDVELIGENATVTFTLVTANIDDGSNIYYSLTGNIDLNDIIGSNTGVITISSNGGTLEITANADSVTEEIEVFQLQLRGDSTTGPIHTTVANVIQILDTSNAEVGGGGGGDPIWPASPGPTPLSASGGNTLIYLDGAGQAWKSHTFTGGGTFSISSISPNSPFNTIEYIVVGGGAGGGKDQGGGGGAGGFIPGSFVATAPSSLTVTVGGGGGAGNNTPKSGSPSSLSGPAVPAAITAYGGGTGGNIGNPGTGGSGTYGSGGGAAGDHTGTGGAGTPGQGYAGGDSVPTAGGGGGGAAGAGGNASANAGGSGGAAATSNIMAGYDIEYAGGGGGGGFKAPATYYSSGGGAGAGIGNTGTDGNVPRSRWDVGLRTALTNAQIANRGSGGGGGLGAGDPENFGGSGSSGVVILRYKVDGSAISPAPSVNTLMVGGGGGGGQSTPTSNEAGGGGAGGLIYYPGMSITSGTTYTVVVGAGGTSNTNGVSSTFGTGPGSELLIALGGGHGGSGNPGQPYDDPAPGMGGHGGSGGGGSHDTQGKGLGIQTTSPSIPADSRTYGFGYDGSNGGEGNGGGGGGAAEAGGTDGTSLGGDGREYDITGVSKFYAGGGDHGDNTSGSQGGGGYAYDWDWDIPAVTNSGGGGRGSYALNQVLERVPTGGQGGLGGSGVVIFSHPSTYGKANVTGNVNIIAATGNVVYEFTSSGTITF